MHKARTTNGIGDQRLWLSPDSGGPRGEVAQAERSQGEGGVGDCARPQGGAGLVKKTLKKDYSGTQENVLKTF